MPSHSSHNGAADVFGLSLVHVPAVEGPKSIESQAALLT